MRVKRGVLLVRAGAAAVMVAAGVGSGDVARSAVGAGPRRELAPGGTGALAGVAAVSPRLAWAVGGTGSGHLLIERWDGVSWRRVRGLAGVDGELEAVAAVSAHDAWAVGVTKAGFPLIARWDGVSWHRVRLAGPRGVLSGVSAVSPGDAWAVGSSGEGRSSKPLALRWDGRAWTRVPGAGLGGRHGALSGVSAVSDADAWAVGVVGIADPEGVIEHWNGSRWRIALIDRSAVVITAVAARGGGFAWAVGWSGVGVLTLAWHGSAWRRVPARCASDGCFLFSVAVVSRRLAWAVGTRLDPRTDDSLLPVIMRWNGSAWRAVPSPRGGGQLDGVVALSRRSAFAVGGTGAIVGSIGKSRPTIEHWNGTVWRIDH
jgi:hypothetical protein